jgi:hypothetical protein
MNSPIHSQPVKSADAASTREQNKGFFMPIIPAGMNSPSFDSFIPRENLDDRRTKEIEEEEKEKKRNNAQQASVALSTPQPPSDPSSITDDVSLESPTKDQRQPANSTSQSESSQLPSRKGETSKDTDAQNLQSHTSTEATSSDHSSELEISTEPVTSGTDHAVENEDMISLAAMDPADAGQPIAVAKEASITTSGRLNSFTVADRLATSSLTSPGTNPNSDSNLGQSTTGSPTLAASAQTPKNTKSTDSTASSMLRSLRVEIEKFTQTNRSQLQLELPVSESESVKVRLSMRGNELHTVFVTESAELREALQKAWPEFSQNSRDRGFRFNDPAFQQSANQQNASSGEREDRERTPPSPVVAVPAIKPKNGTPNLQQPTRPGSVSLWA